MQNPFSWHYLTAPIYDMPTWGPFSVAYVVIFALGLVASILLYYDVGHRTRRDEILHPIVQKATSISGTIFGVGLFFFVFRYLHVSAFGLHMRLWLYLTVLALLVEAGYFVWYFRTVYPGQVQARERERVKQRYLEPAFAGAGGRRRSRKKKRH